MHNTKFSRVCIVFSLSILLLMSVGAKCQNEKLAQNQVLDFALLTADLGNIDPHYSSTTADRILVDMIFNGLVRYKPGQHPKMEPDLAKEIPEPKMVDGKQVWTFHLQKGVMTQPFPGYPEGYELTAEDVVYSFRKAADPQRSAYAGAYDGIEFKEVGKYTVEFHLETPLSPTLFLPKVIDRQGGFIIPKKAIEAIGTKEFSSHPVGTGPFAFEKYIPQQKIVLKRHANYFRGKPVLEEVQGEFIAETTSGEIALEKGQLDAMLGPTEQPFVEKMKKAKGIKVDVIGPGENVVLYYNMKTEPLNSLKVRKALAYALGRDKIVGLFGEDICSPTYSQVPANYMKGAVTKEDLEKANIKWEIGPPNFKKAKELLEEAGYPNGFKLTAFTSQRRYYLKPFEIVKEELSKIGVTLNLKVIDHSTYHTRIRQDANPIVFYNCWRANPDVYLTRFFHSDSIVVTGKSPDTNFSHARMVDDLIEEARRTLDPAKQIKLWKEAQIKLLENVTHSAFGILNLVVARSSSVDWGHPVESSVALYPQITENTRILAD